MISKVIQFIHENNVNIYLRTHMHTHTVSYIVCVQCCCCSLQTKLLLWYRVGEGFLKYMDTIYLQKNSTHEEWPELCPFEEKRCVVSWSMIQASRSPFFFQWMCNIHLWKYTPVGCVIYTCEIIHLCNIHLLVKIWWGAESLFRTVVALRDFYGLVSSTFFHEKALW